MENTPPILHQFYTNFLTRDMVVPFASSSHCHCQFHSHERDCDTSDTSDTDEEIEYRKRSPSDSEMKQLLKKLIKKVDSNDRVLKELQKNQETSSTTYVYIIVHIW